MSAARQPSNAVRAGALVKIAGAVLLAALLAPSLPARAQKPSSQKQGSANDYYARAESHMQAGRFQDALDDFQQVIRLAPNFPGGHYGSGVARLNMRQFHEAVRDFEQTIRLKPDLAEAHVYKGSAHLPQLEARFGTWAAPSAAKGVKAFSAPPARQSKPRIVLIDRPGSPQSVIIGGQVTPVDPMGDIVPISGASEVFGGNFLSRINMDLRETKGWSYGVRGAVGLNIHAVPYTISAPVQADRTGDSIRALNAQLSDILGKKGVTRDELTRLVSNNVDALPGRFETSAAVLQAMITNDLYKRPDDYYEQLAGKYRGLTQAQLDAALKEAVDPRGFVWVVVGDAKTVRPQLARLGMPIEVIEAR